MDALGTAGAAAHDACKCAVHVAAAAVLQDAHGVRGGSRRHVAGAGAGVALGRANAAASTLHLGLGLVALAGRLLVVALAGRGGRGRRRRRGRRGWRGRRGRRGAGAGHHRVRGLRLDAALARAGLATLQLHEALLSPGSAPAVLHQPVVRAVLGAVAHHQHAVVQLGAAGLREHAALVHLEGHLVRLNGNGHRLLGHRIHESLLVVRLHVHVAGHTVGRDAHRAAGSLADAVLGSVGIAVLRAHRRLLLVLEAVVHEAAAAALVAELLGAIHQLLLGQGHQLASREGPGTLQRASGAESPASGSMPTSLFEWKLDLDMPRTVHQSSPPQFQERYKQVGVAPT